MKRSAFTITTAFGLFLYFSSAFGSCPPLQATCIDARGDTLGHVSYASKNFIAGIPEFLTTLCTIKEPGAGPHILSRCREEVSPDTVQVIGQTKAKWVFGFPPHWEGYCGDHCIYPTPEVLAVILNQNK